MHVRPQSSARMHKCYDGLSVIALARGPSRNGSYCTISERALMDVNQYRAKRGTTRSCGINATTAESMRSSASQERGLLNRVRPIANRVCGRFGGPAVHALVKIMRLRDRS